MRTRKGRAISIALACGLACVVLLPLLGHRVLADWDEGIYAEVAREMLRAPGWAGGWLTPHWNFQPWMEKPPLEMWLTAAMFRVFGVSEFGARAVSAFAGVATVGVLHAWMLRRFGQTSAWLATVFLLASFGFQHAARVGETDVLLSLWVLVALIGLARLVAGERGGWWMFWVGFALAAMTKGAASGPIVAALVVLLAVDAGARRVMFARARMSECIGGGLVFAAIVVPWHAWMLHLYSHEFVHVYLGWQVFGRATQAMEGHFTHFWYYAWVLFVSVPLIALLYPFAVVAAWREERLRTLRPFAVFAVVDLVLFTLVRTRLPHYICPVYAPLSALTAVWVARRFDVWREARRPSRVMVAAFSAAAVLLFAGCVALTSHARSGLHSPKLADGTVAPDDREEAMLLKRFFGKDAAHADARASGVEGSLLLWRAGHFVPINSAVFYSRRPVQQVGVDVPVHTFVKDVYADNPWPLADSVEDGPRWMLAETRLLGTLPADLTFEAVEAGPTMELGVVRRRLTSGGDSR